MEFRIADTFTASLGHLPAQDQKAAKTTVFDIQVDPTAPGLRLHRVDRSPDKNFWTARVNDDIRIVLHRTAASLLLCYVDRHDDAYRWAERRRIEAHPTTGAAQMVEVVQRGEQLPLPLTQPATPPAEPPPNKAVALFAAYSAEQLLAYGVPPDWIVPVQAVDDDGLFDLASRLPAEAMDALLELAVGGKPAMPVKAAPAADPFAHPDAQRRFRVIANQEELRLALDYPWEKWTVFLHPGAARRGGAALRRPGPRQRFGRYRQNGGGVAPCSPPCPALRRGARAAGDVFEDPGKAMQGEARPSDRSRRAGRHAHHSRLCGLGRPPTARGGVRQHPEHRLRQPGGRRAWRARRRNGAKSGSASASC